MADIFDRIVDLGVSAADTISKAKANTSLTRDYLTNPSTGLQTFTGNQLAIIISTYESLKSQGLVNAAVINATIEAIERVRAAFERSVRSLGLVFMNIAGQGGIDTINRVSAQLIADKRAELSAIGQGAVIGGNGAVVSTAGIGSIGGNVEILGQSIPVVLLIAVAVLLYFILRK